MTEPWVIVLATRNENKVRELAAMLAGLPIRLESIGSYPDAPDVEETGATFAENAVLKAKAAAQHTGLWAMADDSGLEVDALDGQPGVYSARFAGPGATDADNNEKLLKLMADVPDDRRTARFRCAIALAAPDGRIFVDEGTCEGRIALRRAARAASVTIRSLSFRNWGGRLRSCQQRKRIVSAIEEGP